MYSCVYGRQRGVSLLELMLAVSIIAIILIVTVRQMAVWKATIPQHVAAVQESVAEILRATNAYYYVHCKKLDEVVVLSCEDLVAVGGFANVDDCDKKVSLVTNPLVKQPGFTAKVVQLTDVKDQPYYFLSLSAKFNAPKHSTLEHLAEVLGANYTDGSDEFTWNVLPSYTVTNQGVWYRVPGNYNPVTYTTTTGGSMATGLWIMNSELAVWAKKQANAISQDPDIKKPPTLCPN